MNTTRIIRRGLATTLAVAVGLTLAGATVAPAANATERKPPVNITKVVDTAKKNHSRVVISYPNAKRGATIRVRWDHGSLWSCDSAKWGNGSCWDYDPNSEKTGSRKITLPRGKNHVAVSIPVDVARNAAPRTDALRRTFVYAGPDTIRVHTPRRGNPDGVGLASYPYWTRSLENPYLHRVVVR